MTTLAATMLSLAVAGLAACAAAPPDQTAINALFDEYMAAQKTANTLPLPAPAARITLVERQIEAARGLQRAKALDVQATGFELEAQAAATIGREADGLAALARFDPSGLAPALQAEYFYVRGCVAFRIASEQAAMDLDRAVALAPNQRLARHFKQLRHICKHEPVPDELGPLESVNLTP